MTALTTLDITRVRTLCGTPVTELVELLAEVDTYHSPELDCARFSLDIVSHADVASNHAHRVLDQWRRRVSENKAARPTPAEEQTAALALYVADLERANFDIRDICSARSRCVEQAAVFRYALSESLLSDQQLVDLVSDANPDVRRIAAHLLGERSHPERIQLIMKLIEDADGRVRTRAWTAARCSGERALVEYLAEQGNMYELGWLGDKRARPAIEQLVKGDDPYGWEEGGAKAIALGDRDLLAVLWAHSDWSVRANGLVVSADEGLLDDDTFEVALNRENAEALAELAVRWPERRMSQLVQLVDRMAQIAKGSPNASELHTGSTSTIDKVIAAIASNPAIAGAAVRLLPEQAAIAFAEEQLAADNPDVRSWTCSAIASRKLTACYPGVAELCLDSNESVADAAVRAIMRADMACGLYGLDTAILKACNEGRSAGLASLVFSRLVEALLFRQRT